MNKQPAIIDWEHTTKFFGGNEKIAHEMINLLKDTLPNDFSVIKTAFEKNDLIAMQADIHKLHGAVGYCGIPVFKQALLELEIALKNNVRHNIPTLFTKLEEIVNQFLVETHE